MVEWLAHYVTLGFDAIVVYDNSSSDATADIVGACAVVDNRISLRRWPDLAGQVPQTTAYADALERARTEWIAFFDADELLVLNQHNHIHEFLRRYTEEAGAIAINWLQFGSSGETSYRNELQSIRFTWCGHNDMIKTIARVRCATNPFSHAVDLLSGSYFNDRAEPIELHNKCRTPYISYDFAQLNHYILRSAQEYEEKRARGYVARAPGEINYPPRDDTFWRLNDKHTRQDAAIEKWIVRSADARKIFMEASYMARASRISSQMHPGC